MISETGCRRDVRTVETKDRSAKAELGCSMRPHRTSADGRQFLKLTGGLYGKTMEFAVAGKLEAARRQDVAYERGGGRRADYLL